MRKYSCYVLGYLRTGNECAANKIAFGQLLRETEALSIPFFERPTIEVAPSLVGCVLVHGETAGMIVETEAYLGEGDLAAHASRGRTERTKVLFGPPGRAYVYFSYGMHECLNVVADREGTAGCVLLRALEPLCGVAEMYQRRNWHGPVKGLANGPGKLTQALGVTRADYGRRLDRGELTIRAWRKKPEFELAVTPRVGITHCADWPLRFIWAGHPCLSRTSPRSAAEPRL
jgi:DNA-3-methyladenine glycosylase